MPPTGPAMRAAPAVTKVEVGYAVLTVPLQRTVAVPVVKLVTVGTTAEVVAATSELAG